MSPLSKAHSIPDLRRIARRKLPRMIFDYIDGGAEDEVTLRRQVERFDDYELTWKALRDVSSIDTTSQIMGAKSALPICVAPTAVMRLFHPMEGELAVARAAEAAGIPIAVSTLSSQTLATIAEAAPTVGKFIQIYVWKDRGLVKAFMDRAKQVGYTGCILTVDTAVSGLRERDLRNGFSIPPKLSPSAVWQFAQKPGYLFDLGSSGKIGPENFEGINLGNRSIIEVINHLFDPSMSWDDAAWMVEEWGGPFAIKGISRAEDALQALKVGASTVWLSNHGGRQLDTAVPVIDLIPQIRDAVGNSVEIIADGGVRRGSHALKLIARGADGVATGRAILYGLAAGGQDGVERALEILAEDCRRTLALLGTPNLADLDDSLMLLRSTSI